MEHPASSEVGTRENLIFTPKKERGSTNFLHFYKAL
jgi:hypothetical protein